jgi:membrane protease YdiL (CAAX protease family)
VFWVANIVAAILFGLGHLPVTAHLVPLTSVVVARAVVLNGIVGLVAGTLFWRRGIEMAILCHFSADVVLHVGAPLLQSLLPLPSGT